MDSTAAILAQLGIDRDDVVRFAAKVPRRHAPRGRPPFLLEVYADVYADLKRGNTNVRKSCLRHGVTRQGFYMWCRKVKAGRYQLPASVGKPTVSSA